MSGFNWLDALGAGVNLYTGIKSANAAEDAAKYQAEAAQQAAGNFRPYSELGDYAAGELQGSLNDQDLFRKFSRADLDNDPGYQFAMKEGLKGVRKYGPQGLRQSGAADKWQIEHAAGIADQYYNSAFNRDNIDKTRKYNMLSGGVSAGQGAQGTVGNFLAGTGDARAAGTIGSNNAINQGIGGAYDVLADRRAQDQAQKNYDKYWTKRSV